MKYSEFVEPVTALKTRSAELILKAAGSEQPVVITQNGKATAVLQEIRSFERQKQALLLLKYLARADDEIRRGEGISHKEVKRRLEEKLGDMGD